MQLLYLHLGYKPVGIAAIVEPHYWLVRLGVKHKKAIIVLANFQHLFAPDEE